MPIFDATHRRDAATALALLSQLPTHEADAMPVKEISKILLVAAKAKPDLKKKIPVLSKFFDAKAFELAAAEASRWRNPLVCQWLYQTAKLCSVEMTEKTLAYILRGHSGNSALAASLIEAIIESSAGKMSASLLNELLTECKASGCPEAARLLMQVGGTCTASDEVSRQAKYISLCGKEGNFDEVVATFNLVQESGLNPFVYNCLISACIDCLKPDMALSYFAQSRCRNLVDVVTYNTVIKLHLASNDTEQARRLLSEMLSNGIVSSRVTYQLFISALKQHGRCEEIVSLVDEMKTLQLPMSSAAICMSHLLTSCIHARLVKEAISAHNKGLQHGMCTYDDKAYTGIVRALLEVGSPDAAAKFIRCAYNLSDHDLIQSAGAPAGVAVDCLIEVILALGTQSVSGQALLKDLHQRGVEVPLPPSHTPTRIPRRQTPNAMPRNGLKSASN